MTFLTAGLLLTGSAGESTEKVAVLAAGVNTVSLNPLTLSGRLISTLFDGLTRLEDEGTEPGPALAESWTVSADGLEYVFKLRRGVVFHDGSPLTADDARFSLETICHRDNLRVADLYIRSYAQIRGCPEYRAGQVDRVEGLEVLDSHTLRVRLTEPSTSFLVSAAGNGVVPRARYGGIPVKDLPQHSLSRAPIGTGPFSFVEWREGDRLVLRANSRYFLGRPKLDGLVIRYIADPATRLLEFKNGGAHFGYNAPVPPLDLAAVAGDPRLVSKTYRGTWLHAFAMDNTNPLFSDVRVRRALNHAFDRERILKDVWAGQGRIFNSPLNPTWPEFNPRIAVPRYDPALAKRLLADAGWQPDSDGILQKDGRRFEFTLLSHLGPSRTLAVIYQDYLKRIGIDTRIETVDFPTLWGVRFRPGRFQAVSTEIALGYGDPSYNLGHFQCGSGRLGYCSREVDALIARARSALDSTERARVYWRLQEVLAQEVTVISIVNPDEVRLVSSKLVLPDRQNDYFALMAVRHWELRD
jgi:peptide/nickel transport system substrate-binding protein